MAKKRYLVEVHNAGSNLAAYVPDVETILATGDTLDELIASVRAGFTLLFNLDGQERDAAGNLLPRRPLPEPKATHLYVEIDDADEQEAEENAS